MTQFQIAHGRGRVHAIEVLRVGRKAYVALERRERHAGITGIGVVDRRIGIGQPGRRRCATRTAIQIAPSGEAEGHDGRVIYMGHLEIAGRIHRPVPVHQGQHGRGIEHGRAAGHCAIGDLVRPFQYAAPRAQTPVAATEEVDPAHDVTAGADVHIAAIEYLQGAGHDSA